MIRLMISILSMLAMGSLSAFAKQQEIRLQELISAKQLKQVASGRLDQLIAKDSSLGLQINDYFAAHNWDPAFGQPSRIFKFDLVNVYEGTALGRNLRVIALVPGVGDFSPSKGQVLTVYGPVIATDSGELVGEHFEGAIFIK